MIAEAWPWLVVLIPVLLLLKYLTSRYYRLLSAVPPSKAPRFVGHALEFARDPKEILNTMLKIFNDPENPKSVMPIWSGPYCFVYLRDLSDIEKLLSSNVNLRKSYNYTFVEPWLGQGLINSDGEIWRFHRKLITPSFHFKVLEGFFEIMKSKLDIFFELIDDKVGSGSFDIEPYIGNYSLDVITETAMSSQIDAQKKSSKFVDSIKSLTEIIIVRSVRVWLHFKILFYFSSFGFLERKSTSYVSNFITQVINQKRNEEVLDKKVDPETDDIGEKKKLALLDMLTEAQQRNPKMKDKEIIDEVNTFMFAGHDTTTSAMGFVLYNLAVHQDIQEKVYLELSEQLGTNKMTFKDLSSLKYLERVIKESLRLYPSVPYIGRKLNEEMTITGGYTLPVDAEVAIFIYNHHRNPEIWPEPEKFDPDRFLPENMAGRHPYAYIPFSAGSRNCIGQKFAMMEVMVTVAELLRRYKIIIEPGFKICVISHIVLRTDENGIRVLLEKR